MANGKARFSKFMLGVGFDTPHKKKKEQDGLRPLVAEQPIEDFADQQPRDRFHYLFDRTVKKKEKEVTSSREGISSHWFDSMGGFKISRPSPTTSFSDLQRPTLCVR